MSITTELRDYMRDYLCDAPYSSMSSALMSSIDALKSSIASIADRIDQEHEECAGFCRRLEDAASKGEEVTLFGTDYIPLPKDAEGIPFHVGDHVEVPDGLPSEGKPWQVGTIEATLGHGTCHAIVSDNLTESEGTGDAWANCSECGYLLCVLTDPSSPMPNYRPNCGRKVVDDASVD